MNTLFVLGIKALATKQYVPYIVVHTIVLYIVVHTIVLYIVVHTIVLYIVVHTIVLYIVVHTIVLYIVVHTIVLYIVVHTIVLYIVVHTIVLQDLKSSSNILEVSMALVIVCKLIGAEMIPALLPLVPDKMEHPKWVIRMWSVVINIDQ